MASNNKKRQESIWERCKLCAEQMFGGPRCFLHNPTPEMRDSFSSIIKARTNAILDVIEDCLDEVELDLLDIIDDPAKGEV